MEGKIYLISSSHENTGLHSARSQTLVPLAFSSHTLPSCVTLGSHPVLPGLTQLTLVQSDSAGSNLYSSSPPTVPHVHPYCFIITPTETIYMLVYSSILLQLRVLIFLSHCFSIKIQEVCTLDILWIHGLCSPSLGISKAYFPSLWLSFLIYDMEIVVHLPPVLLWRWKKHKAFQ